MTSRPTAVRRLWRLTAVVAALGLSLPSGAHAAGTGGIEVTPIPGIVNGETVTAFRTQLPGDGKSIEVPFLLRNLTQEPRSARLYAASATRQPDGTFDVGVAGSSEYVELSAEEVQLPPETGQERTFTVTGSADEEQYAAVVVEVQRGSVVQRAATVVYLKPPRTVPIPLLLGLAAGLLVAVAGGAVFLAALRRELKEAQPARNHESSGEF